MEIDFYDSVLRAQNGDMEAVTDILANFTPAIRLARHKTKPDLQDDMKQIIVEKLTEKILTYDLSSTPSFSTFCHNLYQLHAKKQRMNPND